MKKFITLALVFVFAMSLAVPAMAFTGAEKKSSEYAYDLAIKLVDVQDGYVSVNFTAPATNRGYLKNEVVCAVVTLFVPNKSKLGEQFDHLKFTGTNVDLYQSQNFYGANASIPNMGSGTLAFMSSNAFSRLSGGNHFSYQNLTMGNEFRLTNTGLMALQGASGDQTYHFAYFARITADNAFLKATLSGKGQGFGPGYGVKDRGLNGGVVLDEEIIKDSSASTNGLPDGYKLFIYDPRDYTDVRAYLDETLRDGANNNAAGLVYTYANPLNIVASSNFDGIVPAAGNYIADILGDLVGPEELAYIVVEPSRRTVSGKNENLFAIITDKTGLCKRMYVFDPNMQRILDVLKVNSVFPDGAGAKEAKTKHSYDNANTAAPATVGGGVHSKSQYVAFEVGVDTNDGVYFAATTIVRDGYNAAGVAGTYALSGFNMTSKSTGFDATMYNDLIKIVDGVIKGVYGFDPQYRNGYLYLDWWKDFAKKGAISVEVAVEPWYAEVTVPPEIEIDPPKTGDAMNILGFVMIALASLAVVAVRKVRA